MSLFIKKSNVELEDGTKTTVYYLSEKGKTKFEQNHNKLEWTIDKILKLEARLYELELPVKKEKLYVALPDEPHTTEWLRNRIPEFHYGVLNELQKDGLVTRGRMIQKVKKP